MGKYAFDINKVLFSKIRLFLGILLFILSAFFAYFLFVFMYVIRIKSPLPYYKIAKFFCRAITKTLGIRVKIKGNYHVKGSKYIFAANHLSFIDHFITLYAIPGYFRFAALHMIFDLPIIGFIMKRIGTLPIERTFVKEKIDKDLNRVVEALKTGSILIYPEGRFSKDGKLQEFRRGTAEIAMRSGKPVMPMAIAGCFSVLPPPPYKIVKKGLGFISYLIFWLNHNIKSFKSATITVTFGNPQIFQPKQKIEDFTHNLRNQIADLLKV